MNKYYDRKAASIALDEAIQSSVVDVGKAADPSCQHINEVELDGLNIQITGQNRKIWRLGPKADDGSVEDELVFRVQGVLSKLALTPGELAKGAPAYKAAHSSQQVTLVGLDSENFQVGVDNMKHILAFFSRHFHGSADAQWAAVNGTRIAAISASNRFLTSLSDEPDAVHVNFGSGVDPMDRLKFFVGSELVHTTDNAVSYYKQIIESESRRVTYEKAFPNTFRLGDIVEVQMSVIAFESAPKLIKLHCHLRALTLLDATYSKAAAAAQLKEVQDVAPVVVTLKRKVGYQNDLQESSGRKGPSAEKAAATGEAVVQGQGN